MIVSNIIETLKFLRIKICFHGVLIMKVNKSVYKDSYFDYLVLFYLTLLTQIFKIFKKKNTKFTTKF